MTETTRPAIQDRTLQEFNPRQQSSENLRPQTIKFQHLIIFNLLTVPNGMAPAYMIRS
jgi:hypothetical protein